MKPHQLFDWACSNIPAGYFGHDSNRDYVREQINLEYIAFNYHVPFLGKLHFCFYLSTVQVIFYSSPDVSRKEIVALRSKEQNSTRIDC